MLNQLKSCLRNYFQHHYLPCYIFSCRHRQLVLAAYDRDFTDFLPDYAAAFARYKRVNLFIQLGWQHETMDMAQPLAQKLQQAVQNSPHLQITVLANSQKEQTVLSELGLPVVLCPQNSFLDAGRYRIVPHAKKLYDAIYLARITPFKRHFLAGQVNSLRLIGAWSAPEADFARETLGKLPQASYRKQVPGRRVYQEFNHARCGLALSEVEGAMFVAGEYLLCGLPVVNTANLGGRDTLMPKLANYQVADTPEAVAQGVKQVVAKPPDARQIRQETLDLMRPYRELLSKLLYESSGRKMALPHKLGLRCGLSIWQSLFHGLRRI